MPLTARADQNNSLVFDKGNDGVLCASRKLWCKWKSPNLPLCCFQPPSFPGFLPLPPPAPRVLRLRLIHSSSPCARSIIKSFSCCFLPGTMSVCPVFLFTFLPLFYSPSSFTFSMSRLEEICACQEALCYLWSIAIHSAGLHVLLSTECQFNTLLYTLKPLLLGHRTKVFVTDSIFLHYTDLTSFCVWKSQRNQPGFDLYSVISGSWICAVSFDVIFQCQHPFFFLANKPQIRLSSASSECFLQDWSDCQGVKWILRVWAAALERKTWNFSSFGCIEEQKISQT